MKHKLKIAAVLMGALFGMLYITVYAEESKKEESYVRIELGGAYAGKTILYDKESDRALAYPNDGENRTLIRNREKVTIFYGKYRGKEEYQNASGNYPELSSEFFEEPIRKLELTESELETNDYQMTLTEPDEIEPFLVALSYAGVIDNETVGIESVKILFDISGRPLEVRFDLNSELYEEELLTQRFEYITEGIFEEAYAETEAEIADIKPMEEVEVVDYIDELSNVVKIVDYHFLNVLEAQTEALAQKAGWDKKAVFAYLEMVDYKFSRFSRGYEGQMITQEEYLEQLDRVYKTAHLVGSDVYTYMFSQSSLKPKEKALLVITQLGGYIDSNGMLQLKNKDMFYMEMPPHSEFLEDYAETVRAAYAKKNKTYRRLDNQMIHQFRMYIDKHNIDYVRTRFEGRTDYEKLKKYAEEFGFSLYYGEPSRHHNKFSDTVPFEGQICDKILTPNRLSEFIVNVKTGEFVTEWDILKNNQWQDVLSAEKAYSSETMTAEKKIVDTESFNYAPADYVEAHQKLDVLPASPSKKGDSKLYLENDLKRKLKERWKSPNKKEYKEKYRISKDYLQ